MQYVKNFLISVFLIGYLSANAQDPMLVDRDWYLDHFTLDGVTQSPPFSAFHRILNISNDVFYVNHPYCS